MGRTATEHTLNGETNDTFFTRTFEEANVADQARVDAPFADAIAKGRDAQASLLTPLNHNNGDEAPQNDWDKFVHGVRGATPITSAPSLRVVATSPPQEEQPVRRHPSLGNL